MHKKGLGLIVIIIIILLGFLIFKNPDQNDPIKIGSISILTGEGASWGEAAVNGIELAIDEINGSGGLLGRQVVHISENDQSDPAKAVAAFQKLTTIDDVEFIIGPTWSKQGSAIKDLVSEQIVISPSLGKSEFNESSPYIFNTWMHDYILSEKVANYAYEKGHRNIAILGANDIWVKEQTNSVRNRFIELGGNVEYVYEPMTDTRDLRTALLKINGYDIDAIIITSNGYGITALYGKQLDELGITFPVFAVTLDESVISDCLGTCDSWEYLSGLTPTKPFEEFYISRYNREIQIGADSAYDAVMLIAEAIKNIKSTNTKDVKNYLNNLTHYDGASGKLIADGKGGFTKEYKAYVIEGGNSVEIND